MSLFYNILLIVLWNLIVPILIGYLITKFMKSDDKNNIAINFLIGFIVMLGIFQPITLIAIYLKVSLTFLTMLVKLVWGTLSIVSIVINHKRIFVTMSHVTIVLKKFNIYLFGALLLIMLQGYSYIAYEHIDDDDAFFVATATTAVANDNLYVKSPYSGVTYKNLPDRYILSPFSIYYAVMSKLTLVHATVYAHLFLPLVLLLFVYMVYYLWGKEWFQKSESLGVYLVLISIINIFGNYSEFTTQSFLLFRLWQGKAFLAAGILPFLLYLCYKTRKEMEYLFFIALFFGTLAASHVSSMGIFLAPLLIGCWALVDLIMTKKLTRLFCYMLCCLPSILCGLLYVIIS
ncbi:DUF6077 domain-containing protein [Candidatus Galacturonibacter soehngenii]|uniref:Cytochrome b/b6 N-terminal region profile domain-containing protein n=1 Tax=Candidatus Galacturonatibacter soehngenii TaxID=2307010 RepID=A0A7V7QKM4_9FIRM|nr:DUF6077 domain-containing protein [Candidatus Galacturonibacter soehngenii]KAB1438261.1 hypothetical protein F7O84_11970 [Candidatus Galacturonibacter soehngenii]